MREKYGKVTSDKIPTVIFIIITIVIIVISTYTSQYRNRIKEPGAVPVWVKWNNKTYNITGKTTVSVGKKLGVSESTSTRSQRDLYSIPNVNSDKEIAIEQLGDQYFQAVAK